MGFVNRIALAVVLAVVWDLVALFSAIAAESPAMQEEARADQDRTNVLAVVVLLQERPLKAQATNNRPRHQDRRLRRTQSPQESRIQSPWENPIQSPQEIRQ